MTAWQSQLFIGKKQSQVINQTNIKMITISIVISNI